MKNVLIVVFLLNVFFLKAQESTIENESKKITFSPYFGIGRSQFNSSPRAQSTFPSLEFRGGPTINIPLNSSFAISSGFIFGGRIKREAFNKSGQGYTIYPPYLDLDAVASSRNHYFFEIPLMLQFNVPHPKLSLSLGGNLRFFMPNNDNVDFLTNRSEFGFLAGISYPLGDRWKIGGEYFAAITNIYTSGGTVDGINFDLEVRSSDLRVFALYRLCKK